MITLYHSPDVDPRPVVHALEGLQLCIANTPEDLGNALAEVRCAILSFPALPELPELHWLQEIGRQHPGIRWVLVTDFSPENVQNLLQLPLGTEVVWSFEIETRLRLLVRRLLSFDPLSHLAVQLLGVEGLDSDLRDAMVEVCRMPRPPRTLGGLANLAGLTREQLRYRWRIQAGDTLTPREFLDRVFMVRILQARLSRCSWETVAEELQVDRKTARRLVEKACVTGEPRHTSTHEH